eukprot:TRINITY_DN23776_c0_g1_i1.p2 TRINITY_DN23776_c0_g1~~TRINITY_DN23776_c0_g1_i1.p2  ORF type:complete len:250 (-),score=20.87 TRINITY_DN23776_c0_g1_i1:1000-1749(-)
MASKSVVLTVYRSMLQESFKLIKSKETLIPREPFILQPGMFEFSTFGPEFQKQLLLDLFPSLQYVPQKGAFDGQELRKAIRVSFKHYANAEEEKIPELVDQAINSLRMLIDQIEMQRCSSVCETQGITVEAVSKFVGKLPSLKDSQYLFYYRIKVINNSDKHVQLWGRHWRIFDAFGSLTAQVPKGAEGVVGRQPSLTPGSSCQYCSQTPLFTKNGVMHGSFQMRTEEENPEEFDAIVAPFQLLGKDLE